MNKDQLFKEKTTQAVHKFWEKDLSPGHDSGDLSIRDEGTGDIYICPRPDEDLDIPNWGEITKDDIVKINIDGEVIGDSGHLPTVEAPMHLHIYRAREDINSIVHSHALWSSAFACTGQNIPLALAEQSLFIGGEVECAEYGSVGSTKLARNIVNALGDDKKAALMRNHGAVCLGKDIEEAFIVSDFLEKGAKTIIAGNVLGEIITRDHEEILDEHLK